MTYFDKVRVVIFAHENRVQSMFLEILLIVGGGYRNLYTRSSRHLSSSENEFHILMGGGTPDKRIPEGLF